MALVGAANAPKKQKVPLAPACEMRFGVSVLKTVFVIQFPVVVMDTAFARTRIGKISAG